MKENGFKLIQDRSRRYSALTITDANYADDIEPLANARAQSDTLLCSLEQGLHVNAHETEYMRFK